jgi:hypothetical protein
MGVLTGEPFTIDHFEAWTRDLTLDSGEKWRLEPFQWAFVEDVFRGFPECWLIVPEGNGKTTLIAGLALYHLKFKPDAAIAVAASSKDQARWLYRQARGFVHRGGAWGLRAYDGYKKVTHSAANGELEIFAADDRTGDGIIPTMCVLDELHRHRNLALYETWRGKLDKRPGAQLLTISTAGEPGGPFEETRERIRQTGASRRDGAFLRAEHPKLVLHEWAVAEDAKVEDMAVVKAANPFSGVTVESLAAAFASPTMTVGHWRRFKCNLATRSEFSAIQEAEWFAAAADEEIPQGVAVDVGLDVAWKWDTTAAVPLWVRDPEFRLFGPAKVLVPPRDGTSLDPHLVEEALTGINDRNPIGTVVMDTSRAEQLAQWIADEFSCTVVDRVQSNRYAVEDYERFMEALRQGWLRHSGDRELTRHALNAVARVLPQGDARFERPTQSRKSVEQQDRRVIDALVAAAMVHSVCASNSNDYVVDVAAMMAGA